MATDKSSVLLYCDLIHTVEKLKDVDAGKLFKHFLRYINDQDPEPPNNLIQIVFEPIKQNLKRDLKKWEKIKGNRSEAGKISAEKRKQQNSTKSTSVESVEQTSTKSTVSVNDNVSVTDNANVNVNDTVIKKEKEPDLIFPFDSKEFLTIWEAWVRFRIEIKKPYQTFSAKQTALQQLSKYDQETAIAMIKQSMANEWKDIYKLKNEGNNNNTQNGNKSSVSELVAKLRESDSGH